MIYICEKCKKEVSQIFYNRETKKWECVNCHHNIEYPLKIKKDDSLQK